VLDALTVAAHVHSDALVRGRGRRGGAGVGVGVGLGVGGWG